MPLLVSSTCAHHQVKSALHNLWYHHIYRWPSRAQVEREPSVPVHKTARSCVMHYTASGIITPIGGHLVHRLREDPLNLCTRWPEAV